MNEELVFRSKLGRWQHPSTNEWYEFSTREGSYKGAYAYTVRHCKGSYRREDSYHTTKDNIHQTYERLGQQGFIQTAYTYPELQKFFRNGEPITMATLIDDAFKTPSLEPLEDSFEAMLKSLD